MTGKVLTVLTFLLAGTVIYAQDAVPGTAPAAAPVLQENQQTAVQNVSDEKKSAEKAAAAEPESGKKEADDAAVKPSASEPQPQLLSVKDGSFRYVRIPGMEPPKKAPAETVAPAVPETPSDNLSEEKDDVAGLFGITVKMANWAIRIFIVLLIVGLVLVYRIHAGRKKRNVFFKHRRK